MISNLTQAYIAGTANANTDVDILAMSTEHLLAVASGFSAQAGSFGIGLTGSFPLLLINNQTHAFVDSNAYVHALGNVLISAEDDSQTTSIAGEASLGGSDVGISAVASAAVTLITKDTRAFIGQFATVKADGTTSSTVNAPNGETSEGDSFPLGFGTEAIHGLSIQRDRVSRPSTSPPPALPAYPASSSNSPVRLASKCYTPTPPPTSTSARR